MVNAYTYLNQLMQAQFEPYFWKTCFIFYRLDWTADIKLELNSWHRTWIVSHSLRYFYMHLIALGSALQKKTFQPTHPSTDLPHQNFFVLYNFQLADIFSTHALHEKSQMLKFCPSLQIFCLTIICLLNQCLENFGKSG